MNLFNNFLERKGITQLYQIISTNEQRIRQRIQQTKLRAEIFTYTIPCIIMLNAYYNNVYLLISTIVVGSSGIVVPYAFYKYYKPFLHKKLNKECGNLFYKQQIIEQLQDPNFQRELIMSLNDFVAKSPHHAATSYAFSLKKHLANQRYDQVMVCLEKFMQHDVIDQEVADYEQTLGIKNYLKSKL